ncbi:MAG: hypothetical protein FWC20_10320 [Oscillospiraceae bacterium]|nr:hypothetical protein [Oscillospiraceae bacterium]MCL2279783.1 hypothetical protein [Oscillospiraceae bacterium]
METLKKDVNERQANFATLYGELFGNTQKAKERQHLEDVYSRFKDRLVETSSLCTQTPFL